MLPKTARRPGVLPRQGLFSLLLLIGVAVAMTWTAASQTLMPIPPHSSTYTSSMIRGFWFQAPVDFRIVGVRVPTSASSAPQNIQLFKMGGNPASICVWPTLTTNYTTLGYWTNVNTTSIIPCDILIQNGDYIGIVGARGTNGGTLYNSYDGSSPYASSIFGNTVNITRFGHQGSNLPITGGVWTELSGTICRVEIYYAAAVNPIPNDAGIASIDEPFGFCAGTEDVVVTLKNFGILPLTSATINWSINGTPQTPYSWTGFLDTLTTATRETQVNLGPRTWAANTAYTVTAYTTMPNNIVDTLNSNDTSTAVIQAAMSGTYTIGGASPDFADFTEAVDALDLYGVCGPVTFSVAGGTYNEELAISEINGASATNTITFDGGTGNAATRIVTYSHTADGAVIMLTGADYLRFRNLTIRATGSQDGSALWFTGDADHNIVEDCILLASTSATSSDAVPLVGSGSTSSNTSSGNTGSFNLIRNNQIRGGYYGIYWRGSGTTDTTNNKGNVFINNDVTDWYYYGMYNYYSSWMVMKNNRFIQRSGGTTNAYGAYIYYANKGPQIVGNLIKGQAYGLRLYRTNYSHYMYNMTWPRARVFNNMIISARTSTSTSYGTYLYYPCYIDFWNNNMIVNSTGSTSYGLYISTSSSYPSVNVRNNMIASTNSNSAARLFYMTNTSPLEALDHNLYYTPYGPGGSSFYFAGSWYSWNTLPKTTWNANSVWGDPYYDDDLNDLHSRSPEGYQAGLSLLPVADDFDGDLRHPTMPCIGADEYPQPPDEFDMAVVKAQLTYAQNKWSRNAGTAVHFARALIENVGLIDDPATITLGLSDNPMNTIGDAMLTETFSPAWDANHQAVVEFSTPITGLPETPNGELYIRAFLPNEENPVNDQAMDLHEIFSDKVHGYEDFYNFEDGNSFSYAAGQLDMAPFTIVNVNGGEAPVIATERIRHDAIILPSDEWVITPGAPLLEGASYRVGFTFRNLAALPLTIEIAYGMSPNPGAMTTFATFSNVGPGNHTAQGLWVANGNAGSPYFNTLPGMGGVYYIGIRVTGVGTGSIWVLDNIKLDDNPSPPPKIGYGAPGAPIGDFIDVDTPPISISVTYKQPGVVNKTFEVATTTDIYGFMGDFLWDVETTTPWITLTKENPAPTLQGYNFTPPRPRQFQTFTLTVNPAGLAPGVHMGYITFYGILFNQDFPPPNQGLTALNEPFRVPVELRIVDGNGGKPGQGVLCETKKGPLTPAGSPYHFIDPTTSNPIASVTVTSGQIDELNICCYPNQLPQNIARMLYVMRYWQINHRGSGWTANITFPYVDQEASMIFDRMQLRGVRQPMPQSWWEDPINGTTSISDPWNSSVTVQDMNEFNIGGNIALAHPYFLIGREPVAAIPRECGLDQNYPNPFNPGTSITYAVSEETHVRLVVYNSLGMEIAVLVDRTQKPGYFSASFDATDLVSGTYFYRMTAGDFTQTRTMTLSK